MRLQETEVLKRKSVLLENLELSEGKVPELACYSHSKRGSIITRALILAKWIILLEMILFPHIAYLPHTTNLRL